LVHTPRVSRHTFMSTAYHTSLAYWNSNVLLGTVPLCWWHLIAEQSMRGDGGTGPNNVFFLYIHCGLWACASPVNWSERFPLRPTREEIPDTVALVMIRPLASGSSKLRCALGLSRQILVLLSSCTNYEKSVPQYIYYENSLTISQTSVPQYIHPVKSLYREFF
jgi:hypothetical protein